MQESIRVDGWDFSYDKDHEFYECRGPVSWNDDHDEEADPSLWQAVLRLEKMLNEDGFDTQANYSEKGWCEIEILPKNN